MPESGRSGYRVLVTEQAASDLKRLDRAIRKRIYNRIKWLGEYADTVVHHQMTSLPDDLKGLCRLRVGDWRIVYWVYHDEQRIVIYGIDHRSEIYKRIR